MVRRSGGQWAQARRVNSAVVVSGNELAPRDVDIRAHTTWEAVAFGRPTNLTGFGLS